MNLKHNAFPPMLLFLFTKPLGSMRINEGTTPVLSLNLQKFVQEAILNEALASSL
jgi:hypothetical protein